MKSKYIFSCLLLLILLVSSCKKEEGFGGNGIVRGRVLHHTAQIPNALVYIKFGAKQSAGRDSASYDAVVMADSAANYEITGLKAGNYYLFATGSDPAFNEMVYGGVAVELKKDDAVVNTNVPVTED